VEKLCLGPLLLFLQLETFRNVLETLDAAEDGPRRIPDRANIGFDTDSSKSPQCMAQGSTANLRHSCPSTSSSEYPVMRAAILFQLVTRCSVSTV
jgi:hypothetical protein